MARLIDLQTYTNDRGNLTVIEKVLPFEIKRVFFIYGVDESVRGKHRHKVTVQAAVAIQGSCTIVNQLPDTSNLQEFDLNQPSQCVILDPKDFHWMHKFSKDCILMVFASEYFDPDDYIYTPYRNEH
jgi:dTDP-4-dehydrorhamnose 3,5-epimerase-like enzyme